MALIECPDCRSRISDRAESCPKCGFPIVSYYQENEDTASAGLDQMTPSDDKPIIENRDAFYTEEITDQQATFFSDRYGEKKRLQDILETARGTGIKALEWAKGFRGTKRIKGILILVTACLLIICIIFITIILVTGESDIPQQTPVAEKAVMFNLNTYNINIRDAPGTESNIIGKIKPKEKVVVIGSRDKWTKIEYKGKEAYVFSNLLKKEKSLDSKGKKKNPLKKQ